MTAPPAIRLLIADDDDLVRAGLRVILDAEADLEVVGEAVDGRDAIRRTVELDPDVVLMDLRMPDMGGIEATRHLVARSATRPRVLVLTTFGHDGYVTGALRAGASGFVLKRSPPAELAAAIRTVHAGSSLVYPLTTLELIAAAAPAEADADALARVSRLTEREADVLRHIVRGASNAEIAATLFVSVETVKSHVRAILSKLDARDRTQAVIIAHDAGWRRR